MYTLNNFKISIQPELRSVISWKEVLYKRNKFIVTELNYYTILDILRIINIEQYSRFQSIDQEKLRFAINSIISENQNLDAEILVKYISTLSCEQLLDIGETYLTTINNYLASANFQMADTKGIVYVNSDIIDFEFIFTNFPNLETLFIYNDATGTITIIDRDFNLLGVYKKQKEIDLFSIFDDYNSYQKKKDQNKFYNAVLNKMLNEYFNPDTYMEDFLDEIFFKLCNLIIKADKYEVEERNLELLEKYYDRLSKDENVEKVITKLLSKRNKKAENIKHIENIIKE